jgi:hypothetical protein
MSFMGVVWLLKGFPTKGVCFLGLSMGGFGHYMELVVLL